MTKRIERLEDNNAARVAWKANKMIGMDYAVLICIGRDGRGMHRFSCTPTDQSQTHRFTMRVTEDKEAVDALGAKLAGRAAAAIEDWAEADQPKQEDRASRAARIAMERLTHIVSDIRAVGERTGGRQHCFEFTMKDGSERKVCANTSSIEWEGGEWADLSPANVEAAVRAFAA